MRSIPLCNKLLRLRYLPGRHFPADFIQQLDGLFPVDSFCGS
jgi:hypothetical protein